VFSNELCTDGVLQSAPWATSALFCFLAPSLPVLPFLYSPSSPPFDMRLPPLLLSLAVFLSPYVAASPLRAPRQNGNVLSLSTPEASPITLSNANYLCPARSISFAGLNPPFSLDVIAFPYDAADTATQQLLVHVGNFTDIYNVASWKVDQSGVAIGQHLVFRLQDAVGNTRYGAERWIVEGNDAECLYVFDVPVFLHATY
jgi:hypothetical protein